MRELQTEEITRAVKEALLRVNYQMGADVMGARRECREKDRSPLSREVLGHIIQNNAIAAKGVDMPHMNRPYKSGYRYRRYCRFPRISSSFLLCAYIIAFLRCRFGKETSAGQYPPVRNLEALLLLWYNINELFRFYTKRRRLIFVWRLKGVKRLVVLCAGVQKKSCPACAQGSLNDHSNVAAGDFRNCVPPVPLRHFYAISAWGCVGK